MLVHADALLRGSGVFVPGVERRRPWWLLPAMIVAFGPVYGMLMGSFGFVWPDRLLQVVYSGIKVPLLLFATTAVCLPGFFALNTVLGLRSDFAEALQAVLAGQAVFGICLASLGPVTRFFYFCCGDYQTALLFNAAMFTVAVRWGAPGDGALVPRADGKTSVPPDHAVRVAGDVRLRRHADGLDAPPLRGSPRRAGQLFPG
jgi:hypothetical protein